MKARSRFRRSLAAVTRLVGECGCTLMKIATEDEALTHDEVRKRFDVFSDAVEIELKIGGPGARGDLVLCREIGIRHIIAPMVESEYGIIDYLNGVHEVFGSDAERLSLGVNIETELAARNIAAVLKGDAKRELHQVTVGRGDLSRSMKTVPDHRRVMELAKLIIRSAHGRKYVTSVGGGIDPGNIAAIVSDLGTDFVNTRNFAFRAETGKSAAARMKIAVRAALEAEIVLCSETGTALALARAKSLAARLRMEAAG